MDQHLTVLCGGQSSEHAISLISAQNVANTLSTAGCLVSVVFIDQKGRWFYLDGSFPINLSEAVKNVDALEPIVPSMHHASHPWLSLSDPNRSYPCDCVLPILHGPMGEDGTVQGLLTLMNLPYVGPDVLGSSLCMHKAAAREILLGHGIESVPFYLVHADQWEKEELLAVFCDWGEDVYVKPIRMGSAVGISHASSETGFFAAMREAFRYDTQIMIEPAMKGRELEVAVRGSLGQLESTLPGEICRGDVFYSYSEKYAASSTSLVQVPADLDPDTAQSVSEQAAEIAEILRCEGMVRIDGYLLESGEYLFSEANTIPGFTSISMYPKMWEHAGDSQAELLKHLVGIAMQRFNARSALESAQPDVQVSV